MPVLLVLAISVLLQVLDREFGVLEASSSVVGCDAPIRRVLLFLAIRLELERSRGLPLGYRAWRNQILL